MLEPAVVFSPDHLCRLTHLFCFCFQVFAEVTVAVPGPDRRGDATNAQLEFSPARASRGISSRPCRGFGPLWRLQPPVCSYIWGRWYSKKTQEGKKRARQGEWKGGV